MDRGKHKSKAPIEPQELHQKAKLPGKGRCLTSQSKTIINWVRVALLLSGWTTKTWQNMSSQSSDGGDYTTVSTWAYHTILNWSGV